jgi:hypothetical protein
MEGVIVFMKIQPTALFSVVILLACAVDPLAKEKQYSNRLRGKERVDL